MNDLPKITFGIIILNGEPFTRYNLQALYPFAHEIIVVEGASPHAAHVATSAGHSTDKTLAVLRRFKAENDPENKLILVTAEDEGHPDGFWPGEKDQQSQAYARRATGEWLWQIDIDEFYLPDDMLRMCTYLQMYPQTTCLTFNAFHFWGGFDYLVEGGLFMHRNFQGERWGAYRRVFKWGPGYHYQTHRPPTVHDDTNRDITSVHKRNMTRQPYGAPVYMYHYTNLFPKQVIPKGVYYAKLGQVAQRKKFESFSAQLDQKKAIRIYNHYGTFNWLQRFNGQHPAVIDILRSDIENGRLDIEMRSTDDIEQLLHSRRYRQITSVLYQIERMRIYSLHMKWSCKRSIARFVYTLAPSVLLRWLPEEWQWKLSRLSASKL